MREYFIFLLLIFCIPLLNTKTFAQLDSCLKLLRIQEALESNPDSVKVDSCIGSLAYGNLYARGWFQVEFTYFELPAPRARKIHLFKNFHNLAWITKVCGKEKFFHLLRILCVKMAMLEQRLQ